MKTWFVWQDRVFPLEDRIVTVGAAARQRDSTDDQPNAMILSKDPSYCCVYVQRAPFRGWAGPHTGGHLRYVHQEIGLARQTDVVRGRNERPRDSTGTKNIHRQKNERKNTDSPFEPRACALATPERVAELIIEAVSSLGGNAAAQ